MCVARFGSSRSQSKKFVEEHGGRIGDIAVYTHGANSTTRRLANPPFNDSDWHRSDKNVRWKYGLPPKWNANVAWGLHFIYHLAPQGI